MDTQVEQLNPHKLWQEKNELILVYKHRDLEYLLYDQIFCPCNEVIVLGRLELEVRDITKVEGEVELIFCCCYCQLPVT